MSIARQNIQLPTDSKLLFDIIQLESKEQQADRNYATLEGMAYELIFASQSDDQNRRESVITYAEAIVNLARFAVAEEKRLLEQVQS